MGKGAQWAIFPPSWRVLHLMAHMLCKITRAHLSEMLDSQRSTYKIEAVVSGEARQGSFPPPQPVPSVIGKGSHIPPLPSAMRSLASPAVARSAQADGGVRVRAQQALQDPGGAARVPARDRPRRQGRGVRGGTGGQGEVHGIWQAPEHGRGNPAGHGDHRLPRCAEGGAAGSSV